MDITTRSDFEETSKLSLHFEQESSEQKENELYSKERMLGQGSFGKVYLVQHNVTKELLVMKCISTFGKSQQEISEMMSESQIQSQLDHPHIIKLKDVFTDAKGRMNLIMEYAEGGDLSNYMKSCQGKNLPEAQIVEWSLQLSETIQYLQQKKIMHRDLKCENIFLTSDKQVKLGDFGISKMLQQTRDKAITFVGTPYYLSPEILEGKPYSFSSDMWALGIIMYEMCTFTKPFEGNSIHFLALKIIKGKYKKISPTVYSLNLRSLVESLLVVDPQKRPAIDEVVKKLQAISNGIKKFSKPRNKSQENLKKNLPVASPVTMAFKPKQQESKLKEQQKAEETKNKLKQQMADNAQKKKQIEEERRKAFNELKQKNKQIIQNGEIVIEGFGKKKEIQQAEETAQKPSKRRKEVVVEIYLGHRKYDPLVDDQLPEIEEEMPQPRKNDVLELSLAQQESLTFASQNVPPQKIKEVLISRMGQEKFDQAYPILKEKLKIMDLEKLEMLYGPTYTELFPTLTEAEMVNCIPLLVILIDTETQQQQDNHDYYEDDLDEKKEEKL